MKFLDSIVARSRRHVRKMMITIGCRLISRRLYELETGGYDSVRLEENLRGMSSESAHLCDRLYHLASQLCVGEWIPICLPERPEDNDVVSHLMAVQDNVNSAKWNLQAIESANIEKVMLILADNIKDPGVKTAAKNLCREIAKKRAKEVLSS